MKILYSQSKNSDNSVFHGENISNVFVKHLNYKNDSFSVSKKTHHHTCVEIHIILSGTQTYEIDGKEVVVKSGEMLIIPKLIKHRLFDFSPNTEKFSITFNSENQPLNQKLTEPIVIKYPMRVLENLRFITTEYNKRLRFSEQMVENAVLEIIVSIFRLVGFAPKEINALPIEEDNRLSLAKRYIKDNIELALTITEIAKYCNLSSKHLSRIFKTTGITAMQYIHLQRIAVIQKLLIEDKLTLKEIATRFNFNNEYYFNAYFKKHAGMPPGEYRKMHTAK